MTAYQSIVQNMIIQSALSERTKKKRLDEIGMFFNRLTDDEQYKVLTALRIGECLSCGGYNPISAHLQKFNGFCEIHQFDDDKKLLMIGKGVVV